MAAGPDSWDAAAEQVLRRPYLDPRVAAAKRREHIELIDRWVNDLAGRSLLKTDLWEEGVAGDELLFALARRGARACGVDVSPRVVAAARQAAGDAEVRLVTASIGALPFAGAAFDVIVSTSTIDHLPDHDAQRAALRELARVLRPGGILVVTVDNRENVGDPLLRLAARAGAVSFPVGPSLSIAELEAMVRSVGLHPTDRGYLVPAPRMLATLTVRAARRLGRGRGEEAVVRVLDVFARAGRRWPRRVASFVAVRAVRSAGGAGRPEQDSNLRPTP